MKYNFNVVAKELNGKQNEKGETLGETLAQFIGSETKGNTVKLFGWMIRLQGKEHLELDEADRKTLYELIDTTDRMFISIKGQLLSILDKK